MGQQLTLCAALGSLLGILDGVHSCFLGFVFMFSFFYHPNLTLPFPFFLRGKVGVIFKHIHLFDLYLSPTKTQLRRSVHIIVIPSFENRCVSLLFGTSKSVLGCASFLQFKQVAVVSSSAWSFHQQEGRGREQVKLLLHVALYLFFNSGTRRPPSQVDVTRCHPWQNGYTALCSYVPGARKLRRRLA